ncbi:hypothetical protein LCGC14_1873320 [marine sediment metagenome]|uniref:Ribbon-helix-helix protein CopG domain-containing protein n=1 Tax=marine sediment metagenome TaxID=412755 RepID=A0A0F9G490_9ZZZZ
MSNYRSVKIPGELVETVIKLIEENNELAYRSHSEFIIDAVRRRVEKLIKNNNNSNK